MARKRRILGLKEGQIETSIIVYVLAVFIAALILIYGFKVVRNLVGTQEDILEVSFKEDLRAAITKKSYEFKNVEVLDFVIPSDFTQICFADLSHYEDPLMLDEISSYGYLFVRDSVYSNVKRNVFMIKNKKLTDGFYAGKIVVNDTNNYFECIDSSNGELKIRLEALGRSGVQVSGAY